MVAALSALLLVGAGCAQLGGTNGDVGIKQAMPAPVTNVLPEPTPAPEAAPTPPPLAPTENIPSLSAEALGNGQVKFNWNVTDDLTAANRFITIEGGVNPVHDGTNYWVRHDHTTRSFIWEGRAPGMHHYRLCITENNNNDTCVKYSNDVTVVVK